MNGVAVLGDGWLSAHLRRALGAERPAPVERPEIVVVVDDSPPPTASIPVVHVSQVGCQFIDDATHRRVARVEDQVTRHPHTIIRRTVLHPDLWTRLDRWSRWPLMIVPHDTRYQPLDVAVLTERVVAAVTSAPMDRTDEIGGAFAYDARDLARSFLAAVDRRRPIIRLNRPGLAGAEHRAGANLTDQRDETGPTWNDYVRTRIGSR